MFKKAVIAGLLVTLFIQKCKHIEDLKKNKTKLSIADVDNLLDKSGLILGNNFVDPLITRLNLKGMLNAAGILQDNTIPRWR